MREFLTLFLFLIAFPAGSAEAPTVLVFGDSLSAGYGIDVDQSWTTLLQARLRGQGYEHRVVNASISGETTEGGASRIHGTMERFDPSVVILELGGNDGLRGLPLEILKQNLLGMVEMIQATGAEVLLTGIQIPPNYGPRYTVPFYRLYGELAREQGLALVPFLIAGIPQQPQLMQNDGIHPKAEAQSMVLDNVWEILQPMLKASR